MAAIPAAAVKEASSFTIIIWSVLGFDYSIVFYFELGFLQLIPVPSRWRLFIFAEVQQLNVQINMFTHNHHMDRFL